MAPKIKIRRGTKAQLPSLGLAEPGFATDSKELYIGDGVSNILFRSSADLSYVDGDDVYFYDDTRSKTLGVAIIQISGSRKSVSTTDQYLRHLDGTPFNQSGTALPWNATLIGISMSEQDDNQTWTVQVRKNDASTSLASLTITNAYENHSWDEDVDFSAGDRIQLYLSGTSIDYPQATAYFRRRK